MGWRSPRTIAAPVVTPAPIATIATEPTGRGVSSQMAQSSQGPSGFPRFEPATVAAHKAPDPLWRWIGDDWWEDPATGHFHWCEGAGTTRGEREAPSGGMGEAIPTATRN